MTLWMAVSCCRKRRKWVDDMSSSEQPFGKGSFRGKAVTIICSDKQKSVHFYMIVLGSEPLPGENLTCPWFRLGEITFNLMPNAVETGQVNSVDVAGTMLWLEVEDLAASHQYFENNLVPVMEYEEELYLVIADPDGLLIEIHKAESDEEIQ